MLKTWKTQNSEVYCQDKETYRKRRETFFFLLFANKIDKIINRTSLHIMIYPNKFSICCLFNEIIKSFIENYIFKKLIVHKYICIIFVHFSNLLVRAVLWPKDLRQVSILHWPNWNTSRNSMKLLICNDYMLCTKCGVFLRFKGKKRF